MRVKNFVILIGAFIVSFLILEVAARAITSDPLSGSWLMVDDYGLVMNRPDTIAVHHRGTTSATYEINALHLRGEMPKAGIPKILVLGDSFTFGWLVEKNQTLTHYLQSQADTSLGAGKVQFLNAGTGGWGTASMADFLTRYTDSINLFAVLVFANATDFNRAAQTKLYEVNDRQSVHRKMIGRSTSIHMKQLITQNPMYRWLVGNSYFVNMLKQVILGLGVSADQGEATAGAEMLMSDKIDMPQQDVQDYNKALLQHLKSVVDGRSIPIYVSSQYHWQYTANAYDWLEPIFQDLKVPFLNNQRFMATATHGKVEGFFINGDPHPTGLTYKILAQKTWDWLSPQLRGSNFGQ